MSNRNEEYLQNAKLVTWGRGGFVVYYSNNHRLEGHGRNIVDLAIEKGIPVVDSTTIPADRIVKFALNSPIPNVDSLEDETTTTAFWNVGKASIPTYARIAQEFGASVYNVDIGQQAKLVKPQITQEQAYDVLARFTLPPTQTRTMQVDELPQCQFCSKDAVVDSKTRMGPHAYLCEEHYRMYGVPPTTRIEKRVKIAYKSSEVPIIVLEPEQNEVRCPHCNEPRIVDPDANYLVTCENCGNRYRVVSQI